MSETTAEFEMMLFRLSEVELRLADALDTKVAVSTVAS